LILTNTICSN